MTRYTIVLVLCLLGARAPGAFGQSARLTFLLGQVETRGSAQPVWRPVTLSQPVAQGDTLRTGKEARAELTFADGSVVRISEQSRMVIKKLTGSGAEQQRGIKVLIGKIWTNAVNLLSGTSTLTVESPTTVAAIRGTVYRMNVAEQATTEIRVYTGEVGVSPVGPTVSPTAAPERPGMLREPGDVPGPRDVTLGEWLEIVRSMQRIVVKPDGTRQVDNFSATEDAAENWVNWNLSRDRLLNR
jgi:hypothetical protein